MIVDAPKTRSGLQMNLPILFCLGVVGLSIWSKPRCPDVPNVNTHDINARPDLQCLMGTRFCHQPLNSPYGNASRHMDYVRRRSTCEWKRGDLPKHKYLFRKLTSAQYDDEGWIDMVVTGAHTHVSPSPSQHLSHCVQVNANGDITVIDRIGPFRSTGGFEWLRFQYEDVGNLQLHRILSPDQEAYVVASSFLALDDTFELIPNPPFSPHHWHLNTPYGMYPYWKEGMPPYSVHPSMQIQEHALVHQQHADSSCHSEKEGLGCLFMELPRGKGVRLKKGMLTAFGETNDVRRVASPSLESYIEVSVTISTRPHRPVYFWFLKACRGQTHSKNAPSSSWPMSYR